jgi:hypothetical protein
MCYSYHININVTCSILISCCLVGSKRRWLLFELLNMTLHLVVGFANVLRLLVGCLISQLRRRASLEAHSSRLVLLEQVKLQVT